MASLHCIYAAFFADFIYIIIEPFFLPISFALAVSVEGGTDILWLLYSRPPLAEVAENRSGARTQVEFGGRGGSVDEGDLQTATRLRQSIL